MALHVPPIKRLHDRLEVAIEENEQFRRGSQFVPPGHYYSPIPDLGEVARDADRIYSSPPRHLPGLDMNESAQLELLEQLLPFYEEQPFTSEPQKGYRYHFNNPAYSYSDGIFLHCMLRHLQPKRIIEVGSGYSSCMMLDTRDRYLSPDTQITFIEPYPELLERLIDKSDVSNTEIKKSRLQDVAIEVFEELDSNDVLFIDSTHVSKVGSDVNYIIFEILPALKPGVHVHFHDIFYPFEYPRSWVEAGRAWTEAYILKAFLAYNSAYSVRLMNTYVQHFHNNYFKDTLPLCLQNPGASIWLRRNGTTQDNE